MRQCLLQRFGDDIAGFVDVAHAVGFVEYNQIPLNILDIVRFSFRKLIGAYHRAGNILERTLTRLLADRVIAFRLQDQTLQTEFIQ